MGCGASRNPNVRVVIIGGGYGGVAAAKALDNHFDVTLVEKRATFNHNMANLRGSVKPEMAAAVLIPYSKTLKFGRVVRGEVTRIEKSSVVLADGQQLPYNYLVIATGRRMNPLMKLTANTVEEARDFFAATRASIVAANNITIIGGGSVGLELAGEIRAAFPDKRITIVQSRDHLLAGEGVSEKFHGKLIEKLTGLNITVLLNERVERDGEGGQTIVPGAATLRLASGKSLQTDLQFWMAGAGRPHSEFAASAFGDALDPATGRIRVNEYGQIVGSTNAFAVGDIAQLPIPEQNLGYFAGLQGQAVAGNIVRAAKGATLKVYKPHTSSVIFLPLGPKDGLAQTPMGVMGKGMVSAIKSKNLFTNQNWKALGLSPPVIA